jgi:hypothetical protein
MTAEPPRPPRGLNVRRGISRVLAIYAPLAAAAVAFVAVQDWTTARSVCAAPYDANLGRQIEYEENPQIGCISPQEAATLAKFDAELAQMGDRRTPEERAAAEARAKRDPDIDAKFGIQPPKRREVCKPPPPSIMVNRDKAAVAQCRRGVPLASERFMEAVAIAVGAPVGLLLAAGSVFLLFRLGRWVWRGFAPATSTGRGGDGL